MASTHGRVDDEIDILEAVAPLLVRWRLLLLMFCVGGVIGFVVATFMPKTYQSSAEIYVQQGSKAASLLGDLPIALGSLGGSSSDYVVALLKSETLLGNVASQLHLARYPEFSRGRPKRTDLLLERLKRKAKVGDGKTGTVDITVTAQSPYLAAQIANTMLEWLGKMIVTSSRRKADFISQKLDETSRDLRKAEDTMLVFAQQNDIAQIDEQTKGAITKLGDLDARLLALDVDLQSVSSLLSNSGELNRLVDLEVRRKAIESSRSYIIEQRDALRSELGRLPDVAARYARLQRRIILLSKTFELLTQQYQLERITQQGEDGDYQIIDRAMPKPKPVSPRKVGSSLVGGLLALAIASLVIMLRRSGGRRTTTRRVTPTPEHEPGEPPAAAQRTGAATGE